MADIATAYVQIVPSARGMKGNLEKEIDGTGAGEESGKKAGSSFISKFKALVAGAAIGKTVVDGLKASLSEGAALEQSMGGVETLFKDSASTVIANAKQAYETAGMSANAYMEQVTSFSASLLQSMGGNTAEAASVADMAMRDMSDNANKFGTDIDSITNAYQGFAKQNYTMLDNLKLGYGGTKSEMERLLADAQELTGVKYDINNLDDVYNAIHAVQDELGVTGTTAKEASQTLSGSVAAMKAAFSNVLGNMALGEDMGPSLEALATTVGTFLTGNLLPMISNIVTALPGSLVTLINAMIPGDISSVVSTAVGNFSGFVAEKLPTILHSGVETITEFATGFFEGIPGFISTAGEMLNQFLAAVLSAIPSLLSAGGQLISNLATGIWNRLPDIISAAAKIITSLITTIVSHLPDILASGVSIVIQLVAGLITKIAELGLAAQKLIKAFSEKWGETDWLDLGRQIINGIVDGITKGVSKVVNAAKEAANKAFQAAKDALGIKSPSRLFRHGIGLMVSKGMALGITDGLPIIRRAMDQITRTATTDVVSAVRINASGAGTAGSYNAMSTGPRVNLVQNIYSKAQTAAELMQEARYNAEMAVLIGV